MSMLIIRNGTVYDGSGNAPYQADVLADGGVIREIGRGIEAPAGAQAIDAAGLAVTPGFVDIHRHADAAVFLSPDFRETELAQGITTAVMGNCGIAPVPCTPVYSDEYYRSIEPVIGKVPDGFEKNRFETYEQFASGLKNLQTPLNLGFLAGAGAIKTAIKGFSKTPFTAQEMARAVRYIEEAMSNGALGLSLGLMYQGECYSSKEELVTMARAAGKAGGVLCAHIRGEGDSLVDSVQEVIDVAEEAGIALNISHFKATGKRNWRSAIFRAIDSIEAARAKGRPVTADFYPYTGGSTTLLSLLPPAFLEDTAGALLAKLGKSAGRAELRGALAKPHAGWDNMAESIGWERVIVSSVSKPENARYGGQSVAAIALEKGCGAVDAVCDLLVSEEGRAGIIVMSMAQEDVDAVAQLPWTCLISDALYGGGASPHPRLNGAFPKFLRDYVVERKVLRMETAVAKMTSMPAARLGIGKRGILKAGNVADILVLDVNTFKDNADYARPSLKAKGIKQVIANGNPVHGSFLAESI